MRTAQREVRNAGLGYPVSVRLDGSEIGVYTTNMTTPAVIATVVIATAAHPKRVIGWPCISCPTTRIVTRGKWANNPLAAQRARWAKVKREKKAA
jgi:hypothetical protein